MTTEDATTEPIRAPRPTRFPAHLAVMLTAETKADIVDRAEGSSQGEIVRDALELGLALREAFNTWPGLEAELERMRLQADVELATALGTFLDRGLKD